MTKYLYRIVLLRYTTLSCPVNLGKPQWYWYKSRFSSNRIGVTTRDKSIWSLERARYPCRGGRFARRGGGLFSTCGYGILFCVKVIESLYCYDTMLLRRKSLYIKNLMSFGYKSINLQSSRWIWNWRMQKCRLFSLGLKVLKNHFGRLLYSADLGHLWAPFANMI